MDSTFGARGQLLLGALLFSTGGAAVKACSLTGWQVAAFRSGVAALALLALMPASRRGWSLRTVLVGIVYAATLTLFVLANKLTTAANTIFLQSTAPLYLIFLGPWLLREPLSRRDLWYVAALATGMSLFFLQVDAPIESAPRPLIGNLLAAGAGACWALTILGLRWLARDPASHGGSPAAAVAVGNVITFLVCSGAAFPVTSSTPLDWWLILYLGVFQIGLAYAFVTAGMRHLSALEASLILLMEPVLNPIWAWTFQREVPGPLALLGGAVIVLSTLLRALQTRAYRSRAP